MIRKYAEFFCWKNVSSFCSAKATHIFSAKNIIILYIESAKTVNEMTFNELTKLTTLWTTGPRQFVFSWSKFFPFRFLKGFSNTMEETSYLWNSEPLVKRRQNLSGHLASSSRKHTYIILTLKPHFYIVKLGFTGVYIIFLISAQKHRLWYSLESPRRGGSNEYPQSMFFSRWGGSNEYHNLCFWAEIRKISEFLSENFQFFGGENFNIFE